MSLPNTQTLDAVGWGEYDRAFEVLGAHRYANHLRFTTWAPNAKRVAVVGSFNAWNETANPMQQVSASGIWSCVVEFEPNSALQSPLANGATYQFSIDGVLKADPYARAAQLRPDQASVLANMPSPKSLPASRHKANQLNAPISIYEMHLGSWRQREGGGFLNWQELAQQVPAYVKSLGFTHVELLPITEHPFDGSWGYQTLGLFAPSARFGNPEDFGLFVDACHNIGLGIILDWVPAHFPTDEFGLAKYDGTPLFEYADPKEGFHKDWKTLIYDFNRAGVRNFLASSALYWLERFAVDGLRVDAVASMLYRDYSRDSGQWIPNTKGGRENLEAVSLFQRINTIVRRVCPHALMIAEESTAWPKVTQEAKDQGLGFHLKWNMGWMHDSLEFMKASGVKRSERYGQLVASLHYAFSEKFVLSLSHDEVVHGKRSLIGKMPTDQANTEQANDQVGAARNSDQLAQLRAYYAFMWAYPGKKLLFMGQEFAQGIEWNHDASLPWEQSKDAAGLATKSLIYDLNQLYSSYPALHELDCDARGFEWLIHDDAHNQVLVWVRKDLACVSSDGRQGQMILVVCNFSDRDLNVYRIGVPQSMYQVQWKEILNTHRAAYQTPISRYTPTSVLRSLKPENIPANRKDHSVQLQCRAFSTSYFVAQPLE